MSARICRFVLQTFAALLGFSIVAMASPGLAQNPPVGLPPLPPMSRVFPPVPGLNPLPTPPAVPGLSSTFSVYGGGIGTLYGMNSGAAGPAKYSSTAPNTLQTKQPTTGSSGLSGGVPPYPYVDRSGSTAAMTSQAARDTRSPGTRADTARMQRLLGLSDDDGLRWPLALRILPPGPDATRLRDHIDQLVKEVRREAPNDQVKPDALEQVEQDIQKLRRLWSARAAYLPVSQEAIEEGQQFLRKVREALR